MKREDVTREIANYIHDSFKRYTQKMGENWAIPIIGDDVKKRYGVNVHLTTVYLFSKQDYDTIMKSRETKKRGNRTKLKPLPGRAGSVSKIAPEISEKDFSYDDFIDSLESLKNGVVPYLKTDNKFAKVLLALDEMDRDVKGKQLSKILGFDVRKCLQIKNSYGMTQHEVYIKHAISETGKEYLRKMSIVS